MIKTVILQVLIIFSPFSLLSKLNLLRQTVRSINFDNFRSRSNSEIYIAYTVFSNAFCTYFGYNIRYSFFSIAWTVRMCYYRFEITRTHSNFSYFQRKRIDGLVKCQKSNVVKKLSQLFDCLIWNNIITYLIERYLPAVSSTKIIWN